MNVKSSDQDPELASSNPSSVGRKSYISSLRRTWKDKSVSPEDVPITATIPPWFVDENIIIYGHGNRPDSPESPQVFVKQWIQSSEWPPPDDEASGLQKSIFEPLNGDSTEVETSRDGASQTTIGDSRYVISSDIWYRLKASVKAGFKIPSAEYANDPATERSHLLLQYPGHHGQRDAIGASIFLHTVVKRLAKEEKASLITLNAQDIARLCSEQVRVESGALSSIRNLGYEVYNDWKRTRKSDTNGDFFDNEDGINGDDEASFSLPDSNIRPRIVSVESNLPDTQLPNWLLSLTGTSAGATGNRTARTETSAWLRVINQLISLSFPPKLGSSDGISLPSDQSVRQADAPRKTVIHIQDYVELMNTPEGSKFLRLLLKTINNHRRQGKSILLIGTSSGIRDWHTDVLKPKPITEQTRLSVDSTTMPFVLPIAVLPSMETSIVNETFSQDRESRIRYINIRHFQDLLRKRVDQDVTPIDNEVFNTASWPKDIGKHAVTGGMIDYEYWYFSRVHQLTTLALGCVKPGEKLSFKHIRQAFIIDERHRRYCDSWYLGGESNTEFSSAPGSSNSSGAFRESRVSKMDMDLQSGCNRYEKKLLNGVVKADRIRTTFSDVHVPSETVQALNTLTSLSLIRPDAFTYGVLATDKIPGVLLYGPPGTGKTLLAKAVARESGATMLEVSGSDVYDMYVGESEKNVRAIFTLAKKLSPCVVFIDEADAIFGSRTLARHRGSTHRELINQFLREWDGMNDMSAFIMVATNRPFDLDDAVLRRLPRRLLVDLPTEQDRESILKIHLKNEQLDPSVDLSDLAHRTPFYSGSDLKNVCVAAALTCVREEYERKMNHTGDAPYQYPPQRILTQAHFDSAVEEISASISEDMSSLDVIRKFDEKFGDRKGRRKRSTAWGFTPLSDAQTLSDTVRVRT